MKVFCSACEKETTDNIAVYENVDGFIIHCGDCNYPLLYIGYDEREVLSQVGANEEVQPDLFCQESCNSSCAECEENEPDELVDFRSLTFTADDLQLVQGLLTAKLKCLDISVNRAESLLHKISTLLEMREDA